MIPKSTMYLSWISPRRSSLYVGIFLAQSDSRLDSQFGDMLFLDLGLGGFRGQNAQQLWNESAAESDQQ
jgi:hypothetical protein